MRGTSTRSAGPVLSTAVIGPTVTPSVPADGTTARHEELDVHRGVAALAIVVFHVYQFCNVGHFLYFGTPAYTVLNSLDAMVPWFFVLTAFLLFEPIARSVIEGRARLSARGFLTRRAVRLLPVYWVSIVVVWSFRQPSLPGDWRDLLEHLTFTQVFDQKRIFYTIGPAWSLSVEVIFYLLLVVVAVAAHRYCQRLAARRARIGVLGAMTGGMAVVALVWKAWAFYGAHQSTTGSFTTWFGPVANLDVFAVGMALAVVAAALGERRPLPSGGRMLLRVLGLAILILAFATRQANSFTGVYFSIVCALGFGCLVAAAVLGPGDRGGRAVARRSLRFVARRPLLFVGAISYSMYLWHEPILLALRGWEGLVRQAPGFFIVDTVVVVAVSVAAGWLSYSLIERPTGQLAGVFDHAGHLRPRYRDDDVEWESFRTGNPI